MPYCFFSQTRTGNARFSGDSQRRHWGAAPSVTVRCGRGRQVSPPPIGNASFLLFEPLHSGPSFLDSTFPHLKDSVPPCNCYPGTAKSSAVVSPKRRLSVSSRLRWKRKPHAGSHQCCATSHPGTTSPAVPGVPLLPPHGTTPACAPLLFQIAPSSFVSGPAPPLYE